MTEEEILALTAGYTADMLVAKEAGWRVNHPSSDIGSSYALEEVVSADDKEDEYVDALESIVEEDGDTPGQLKWKMAHATPLERSKAFLMVYGIT